MLAKRESNFEWAILFDVPTFLCHHTQSPKTKTSTLYIDDDLKSTCTVSSNSMKKDNTKAEITSQ